MQEVIMLEEWVMSDFYFINQKDRETLLLLVRWVMLMVLKSTNQLKKYNVLINIHRDPVQCWWSWALHRLARECGPKCRCLFDVSMWPKFEPKASWDTNWNCLSYHPLSMLIRNAGASLMEPQYYTTLLLPSSSGQDKKKSWMPNGVRCATLL